MIETREIELDTTGAGDIKDITEQLERVVGESEARSGVITAFVPGSTGGLTTLEYEPGLLKDLPQAFERLFPSDRPYHHDETWHDGNGFSHVRSAFIGPDITVPFVEGKLALGTWQQVVFLEFDNRARHRQIVLQIMGE
jgi:secondary thiamine-phosphate synthase enzyme